MKIGVELWILYMIYILYVCLGEIKMWIFVWFYDSECLGFNVEALEIGNEVDFLIK
jgi:hypothetical protein